MSAEDIYKKLLELGEDVGLATVYRVMTQFETAELVSRHHFDSGLSVFELNEGSHHDHLVCEKCGKVEEFSEEDVKPVPRTRFGSLAFFLSFLLFFFLSFTNGSLSSLEPDTLSFLLVFFLSLELLRSLSFLSSLNFFPDFSRRARLSD